jgi:hypothetical protein
MMKDAARRKVARVAVRELCVLLCACAALLWLPAPAAAMPCHGATEAESVAVLAPESHVAGQLSLQRDATASQVVHATEMNSAPTLDCCEGGDCGGACGCAVAALPAHAALPRIAATPAEFIVPSGRRPSLRLPELFRPPIAA